MFLLFLVPALGAPFLTNTTAPAQPVQAPVHPGVALTSSAKAPVVLFAPETAAFRPEQGLATYKATLSRIIAWKRWRMGYFYLFSMRYNAYVSMMPAELSEDMVKLKTYLSKSAIFFDILANNEISGFIYCVLLLTWASPLPTDMMGAIAYYQSIKTVYTFWTWQYFLLFKDYMNLFPEAYAKVDSKVKAFIETSETFACWHAFNEWHVSKMMGVATLTDANSPLTNAKLASFYWDEAFIKTVHTLVGLKLWSWSYPDQAWLTKSQPLIALSLPWIAFVESYWEWIIAGLEQSTTTAAYTMSKVEVSSK